jgi:NADPH2:quinone reductase
MKAWLLDSFTGLSAMRLAEVSEPAPGPGEVVLDVRYAALNPADRYLAEAQYPAKPPLPHILGRDAVGTVSAVAGDVWAWKPGDAAVVLRSEVGVSRAGTFAERVAVPADCLVPIPAGWTAEQAAGATLVYLTAHQALTQWADLPSAAIVLITGASGGVGVASMQLGNALGHTPVALSRGTSKRDALLRAGAVAVFDPTDADWRTRLKEFLKPRRVDLAIDNVGGPLFNDVIDTLADRGRVSCVGRLAGPVPQFNTASLFFRRLKVGGVAVGANTIAESRAGWQTIVDLLDRTGARPLVDRIFAFEQLPGAFARLAQGPLGKVLLRVKGGS